MRPGPNPGAEPIFSRRAPLAGGGLNRLPTTDQRFVRLDMSIEHRMIVRNRIEAWRDGELDDLRTHLGMRNPDAGRQRVATYGRLIEALRLGRISLPEDEARLRLAEAVTSGVQPPRQPAAL